jgi:serine protease AprX
MIISLILVSFGGYTTSISESETNYPLNSIPNENSNVHEAFAAGFIFSKDIEDFTGISTDKNVNGVEDFIETNFNMYKDTEYINTVVTLTKPADDWLITKMESLGCIVDHEFTIIDALGVGIPIDLLTRIGKLPGVEMVQSIHALEHNLNSAVPLTRASQDVLKSNGYKDLTGEGVTIAIIDSGIDANHATFGSNRIIAFKDFYYGNDDLDPTNGMDAQDYGSHGTMTASCAVGQGSYKGVAIKANIISVAVASTYDMIRGIDWSVNNQNKDFTKDGTIDGPDIISMSMGVPGGSDYIDSTAGNAMDNGVVFVTSAGNEGPGAGTVNSPAKAPKVIAVGATNKYNKQIASFSSRGPGKGGVIKPDVVAPGDDIIVATPNNNWGYADGTSFSAPIVAGIAALILQYDPSLDPFEVKDLLTQSAQEMGADGPDNTYGYGFVDAVAALDRVLKIKTIDISPSSTSSTVWEDTRVSFSVTTSGTNIKKYEWDFNNDGEFDKSTTDPSATSTFTDDGIYEILVKITNQRGKTAEKIEVLEITNRKPIAELKIDTQAQIIYEDESIRFNASKSRDTPSDNDNLEFSWSFDGGINFTNFTKDDRIIEYSFNSSTEYQIIMKVRDDNGMEDSESTTVVIQNFKPVANAGEDLLGIEGEPIQFTGIESEDSKSDWPTLGYTWDFGDGVEGYGMNVSHTYQTVRDNQTYFVKLTVKDDDSEKDSMTIAVTIRNKPPTITTVRDKFGTEDEAISFSGTGNDTSNDRDQLRFKWIFGDGNDSKWMMGPDTDHIYTMVGTYHGKLLVKDPKGATSTANVNITIANVPPIAEFVVDSDTALEDEIVTFDASSSSDTDSDLKHLHYIWEFDDGTMGTGKIIEHRFDKAYKFDVKLIVRDDDGATGTFTKRITIENSRPEAVLFVNGDDTYVNDLIRFYGHKSTDTPSDKRTLNYQWDFGDGEHSSGINATHRYSKAGEYMVKLRVSDDDGETDEARAKIVILSEEEEVDMFANPTFENNGIQMYSAIIVALFLLFFIIISLFMVYKGKRSIIGVMQDKLKESKERKAEELAAAEARATIPDGSAMGLSPEQTKFFMDTYGMSPSEFSQYQQSINQSLPSQSHPPNQPPDQWSQKSQQMPMPNYNYQQYPQQPYQQMQQMPPHMQPHKNTGMGVGMGMGRNQGTGPGMDMNRGMGTGSGTRDGSLRMPPPMQPRLPPKKLDDKNSNQ